MHELLRACGTGIDVNATSIPRYFCNNGSGGICRHALCQSVISDDEDQIAHRSALSDLCYILYIITAFVHQSVMMDMRLRVHA
jgi:hypothetical protein